MYIEWNSQTLEEVNRTFVFDKNIKQVEIHMEDWTCRENYIFGHVMNIIETHPQINFNISTDCPLVISNKPNNLKVKWNPNTGYLDKAYKQAKHLDLPTNKNIKHTVCSFNGGYTLQRTALCLLLYKHNLWTKQNCSKIFVSNTDCLKNTHKVNKHIKSLGQKNIKQFLKHQNNIEGKTVDYAHRASVQKSIMDNTFINVIGGPGGEHPVISPYVDEKILMPIINRSLWIMCSTAGWYAYLEKHYGFKLFHDVIDYKFDSIVDWEDRLLHIMDQLVQLNRLSRSKQQKIYEQQKEIIDYNYNHLVSKQWANLN